MATKDDHLKQAEHNLNLAETLAKGKYLDWAVTAYFYAALHYITAILSVQGNLPTSHSKRDPLIQAHKQLRTIFAEYKSLDAMSRNARYFCTPIESGDVTAVQGDFETIKTYIRHSILGIPRD